MKNTFYLIFLLFIAIPNAQAQDEVKTYKLCIYKDSVIESEFKNYSKLALDFENGKYDLSKYKFINDSQMCKVNYFYEVTSDTILIKDVLAVNGIRKGIRTTYPKEKNEKKRIRAGGVVLILLLTNVYGAAYLVIREAIWAIRKSRKNYTNEEPVKSNISFKIIPVTSS